MLFDLSSCVLPDSVPPPDAGSAAASAAQVSHANAHPRTSPPVIPAVTGRRGSECACGSGLLGPA